MDEKLVQLSDWIEHFIGTISERETDDDVYVSLVNMSATERSLIVDYAGEFYSVTIKKEPDITKG